MLPAWIAEELRKQEQRKRKSEEGLRIPLYPPEFYEAPVPPVHDETDEEEAPTSRVVVIEF